ncbi:MAG: cytochrome P450 [Acidimicrobiia bacterium]|nr:cytochrome P450 [Acidimicrobiia bacterium]
MAELIDGPAPQERQAAGDGALIAIFASAKGLEDPNPFYRQLREEAPVHLSGFGGVVLTRYDDCRALLRDNRFGNGTAGPTGAFGGSPEIVAFRQEMMARRGDRPLSMLGLDPPAHTRQRALVSRAFTPRRIEALRTRIAELADECLDRLADAGTADAMKVLAEPFPVSVISEMLGVPASDWPEIRLLVTDLAQMLEPSADLVELKRAEAANNTLWEYFTGLVAARRKAPADDLLTGLIQAGDGDDQLAEGEILAVANLLFGAGAETTTNLLGNTFNALFNHPDQMERLWADPTLVPAAVEEVLRFDSPVQLDGRACLEPAEAAGVRFEPGDRVMTLLGAANRDPAHFPDPDRFDVGRFTADSRGEPILSFASGIHHCLGANLARAEGQEVMAGLIRRFRRIEPAGERPYRRRLVLRGLATCPLTVTPR